MKNMSNFDPELYKTKDKESTIDSIINSLSKFHYTGSEKREIAEDIYHHEHGYDDYHSDYNEIDSDREGS
jgi:hypothetical protein